MKNKYESQRGAILVESALVVGAIFLMLFGTVFLAIIGFDQMSADGASFEVAHQTSVGAAAPPAASHSAFPNIPQSQIVTNSLPAPSPTVPVDYGYNSTDAAVQASSVNDRHGGVSMMQAEQVQGQASKVSTSILGNPITVVGSMIEPLWLENGLHFNAANENGYGGAGGDAGFQGNVLTQGENAPPYFVGFNLMTHCLDNLPWGQTGSCATTAFTALGVSEFLDYQNWCNPGTGNGPPCSIANAGAAGSKQTDSTFATASCHQRVYAAIAKFLEDNPALLTVYLNDAVNKIDNPYQHYGNISSNSFRDFSGFDGGTVDAAVQEVYKWDSPNDISGTPPPGKLLDTPLYPGNGC